MSRTDSNTYGDGMNNYFLEDSPVLKAIIFAEFDNEIGRVVKYQIPHEIFDKQQFDNISSAIIPTEEMRDRMIKINMYDWKIMGYPIGIKDKKYAREIYIFNMCFIVGKDSGKGDDLYEPLVQKCAEYLVDLEKERGFLSLEKHMLPNLMSEIFHGLNLKSSYLQSSNKTVFCLIPKIWQILGIAKLTRLDLCVTDHFRLKTLLYIILVHPVNYIDVYKRMGISDL